ncbi:hypothetical protein EDD90_5517 [Streptomyces sp. Ag109_O5-1]|nr:hypothetical protein EDD90_5517 [Streptomyces sp. Ag109_O5-1]
MRMQRSAFRSISLIAALTCCAVFGAQGASSAGASPKSALQCYATHHSPHTIVCYRNSWKAEFRHGDMVYVPILIQVPTPSRPPSVVIVGSLDDIHP